MISEEQIIKGCIENDRNCQKLLFKKYHHQRQLPVGARGHQTEVFTAG